ncbi:LutC/YkgG family protein [Methylocella tundrae]|uniref:L-lactate dehydrogenase complex protein LldG n=1 Tax=Methylocella tundrae TaxID=227605 RepID=A0A4U8Z2S9_METTU|nr:LUD domain-containing protein [Methylocella tundrae]WPP03548.1 LUD domain-containing protein [Methylocella tundrae]VFU09655.1 L-lactate dehydrogenase complex protein LldG [Methylocella tundrae]
MSVREEILAAIRRNLRREANDPAEIAAQAAALALESNESRPRLPGGDVVDAFAARLVSAKVVGASVDRIGKLEDTPAAVARYCDAHGLEHALALQPDPDLRRLDWSGFTLKTAIAGDERLAVAKARWAIAETGTFVFHSGPTSATLLSFLPLHHICVIERERILLHLEDYALAEKGAGAPRNVNLITGASGTADIEGTLVRGAHGPKFLHAIIIDARASIQTP